MINTRPEIKELYVEDYMVRERDNGDLADWFRGINSVLRPTSIKAKVLRKGEWENCSVTGRISDESKDLLEIRITFRDATTYVKKAMKHAFLPSGLK